jgi:PAS domain S-box-containing protein
VRSKPPAVELLANLASLHHTVLIADEGERVVWVSDELGGLVGGRSLVGHSARELFGSADRHVELRERLDRQGFLANEPLEILREDGSAVPVELSAAFIPSRSSERLILGVVRPTEGPAREAAPTSDYFRAILDGSSDAVLALDRQGFVTYVNGTFERLIRRPAAELVGVPVALVFASQGGLDSVSDALRPQGECGVAELEFERREGGPLVLSVSTCPIRLADGSRAGTVAFLRDVTEERRAERQIERKNQELENYVHTVSHDLRTPLVSLLGFSRLLAQDYGDVLTDTGRHFLQRIEQASRTMEALINDLLELSRIGQANGQRDLVDPLPVLKQLANELKPRLETRSVSLTLPASPPLLLCVRTQLYQVFSNLIGNALDHMGERDDACIEVSIREEPGAHVICVSDNGLGISREDQERVFEIFQTRGHLPGDRRGTGIGLAIVKKIAEAHRGHVRLESAPGKGASFQVSFPRS